MNLSYHLRITKYLKTYNNILAQEINHPIPVSFITDSNSMYPGNKPTSIFFPPLSTILF